MMHSANNIAKQAWDWKSTAHLATASLSCYT